MNNRHYLWFLLLVFALMLVDSLAVYLFVRLSPAAANPQTIFILATIFFLCIPFNMFVAWKIVMRNR